MSKALIIDDEQQMRRLLRMVLEARGYEVSEAADGQLGLQEAAFHRPDVVLLDLGLPGMSGIEVLKRLREWSDVPVLILSVRDQETVKVEALELGADDYVTKPFSPRELLLRVRALLKRTRKVTADASLKSGDFLLERNTLKLFLAGRPVDLTATEFKLLRLLVEASGEVQERDALLREVWGYSDTMLTRTLDTHVKRLREKLGKHAECIQTVRGVGYRFVSSPTPA